MRAGRNGLGVVLAIARSIARAAGTGGIAAALAAMLAIGGCSSSHVRGEDDRDGDGHLASGGDCDDSRVDVHPGGDDSCGPSSCTDSVTGRPDGVDQDCDGRVDEHCGPVINCFDAGPWVPDGGGGVDRDGDGWTEVSDCDDSDPAIHPGAAEVCTTSCETPARDENCDGRIDEGCMIALNCFYDADGDGYGSGFGPGPDCNDADASIHPGAPEYCGDAVDRDCDGDANPSEEGCIIVNGMRDDEGDGTRRS